MKKITKEEFIEKANKIHEKKYSYVNSIYVNSQSKILINCSKHGEFTQTPSNHLQGQGCPDCAINKKRKLFALTAEIFIKKANEKHYNKYIYNDINYINTDTKVKVTCPIHGDWNITPANHLRGKGCPECGGSKQLTTENFIEKANKKHNNKYIYILSIYTNSKKKIIITCPTKNHGNFNQMPNDHLSGYGCPKCAYGKNKSNTEEFVKKAIKIQGDRYYYNNVNYINNAIKVSITCPIKNHGDFNQTPNQHLSGGGCPKCKSGNVSKPETQWLDYLKISIENRQIKLKINSTKYIVDAYVPETNTIYEFNGDYWHGNLDKFKENEVNKQTGKTFGELNSMTIKKEKNILSAGYNLVSIWESEWKKIIIVK